MADLYNPNDEIDLQSALAQVAALRKQSLQGQPQGQVITGRYVAPSKQQMLLPVLQGAVADIGERDANAQKKAMNAAAEADLAAWINRRPQAVENVRAGDEGPVKEIIEPTDQQNIAWAAQGIRNPLAKSLAQDSLKDNIVTAQGRREKLEQRNFQAQLNAENLAAGREATKANLIMSLNQRSQDLQMKLASEEARGHDTNGTRLAIAENTRQLQELKGQQAMALQGLKNEGTAAAAAAKANAPKPMNSTQQKKLEELVGANQQYQDLVSKIKPEYFGTKAAALTAGSPYAGVAEDFGLKMSPEQQASVDWHQQFKALDNPERHALFGSALTKTENASYKQTTIGPTSSYGTAKNLLARRMELEKRAIDRIQKINQGWTFDVDTGKMTPPAAKTNFPRANAPVEAAPSPGGGSFEPGTQWVGTPEQILDAINSLPPGERQKAMSSYTAQTLAGKPAAEAPAPEAQPARKKYNPATGRLE